ncbi:MAG: TolC family protein [Deferrisomatales bacterium]|nr:TolC family protein [Deferrisomatales bacterium]
MNRIRVLLPILWLALPAYAGYRELSDEVEGYQPPLIYNDSQRETAAEQPQGTEQNAAFAAQITALREEQKRWQSALQERAPAEAFFIPDRGELARLDGTAKDSSAAGSALVDGYRLPTLETLVWLRNPGIHAATRRVQAALQQYDQAANLDEILRQYQAFTEGVMPGVGPMKGREPAQMKFPYPDMVALKGQVVNQEVRAAVESLEIARRDALTMARKAHWNLGFLGEALRLTGEMERLLGDLLAVATTRYESGKASFQDVVKVQIALDTLVEERNTLREKRSNGFAMIRRVLALEPGIPVGAPALQTPPAPVPELGGLQALARERRQELRRLDAMIGKMDRMVSMGEVRLHADPTLNLSLYQGEEVLQAGTARMQEPYAGTTSAALGLGTPIKAWYGSGEAYLRETREKLGALREQRRDLEAMVQLQVREAWFDLDQAAREQALYAGSIVDLTGTALEVSTRGYETGNVMFADVIASYTTWLQAHLSAERRRADIGVARAQVAAVVGVDVFGSE